MKKLLLSFLIVLLGITNLSAQRDTDHWFAPFFDSSGTTYNHGLYLSTDSTTPFEVRIFNNGIQINTTPIMISKGNPHFFSLPNTDNSNSFLEASANADAYSVKTKGIYVKGDLPLYVSWRIYNSSHGEFVTSKGKAALGTKFYAAATPMKNPSSSMNFTTGIIATEDNTTVTVTGFNQSVRFVNGPTTNQTTVSFNLNKGQSYLLAGTGATSANTTGFIGAKIESNKPISITNGNSNNVYGNNTYGGSDLIMDQGVPVERLGQEFAMVRSLTYPNLVDRDMEGGIIIATENNTEVYLNGMTLPIATLNEGQFYQIPDAFYQLQLGGNNDHYNMFIRTTKNVYLYQLISVEDQNNTGGFNYIPPLNCYLPRKIDEIGKVNEMPNTAGGTAIPASFIDLKLNIITEAGATVLVNGNPTTPDQGPFPLTGNANWVTYAVFDLSGNLTVTSDKAVTAGLNGGYSTAGYGGYFAGFSSIAVISKRTGDCIPGIILEVADTYESFQWYLNGTAIAGATSHTYTPVAPGEYTCMMTMGSCPPVTTPPYIVTNCTFLSTETVNACGPMQFNPTFSVSNQTVNTSSIVIIQQPAHGVATVNNGVVTYVPDPTYQGNDTLIYQFCSTAAAYQDCEQVTLNLVVEPFITKNAELFSCQYNGRGTYNLEVADVIGITTVTKKYYRTLADLNANTNAISNPTTYNSAPGDVYVKITSDGGCIGTAVITLSVYDVPAVYDATLKECYLDTITNSAVFDLTTADVTAINPVVNTKYYPTLVDATNNTNEIMMPDTYPSQTGSAYVRIYDNKGCYAIAKINLVVILPKKSATLVDKYICLDGRTTLDAGAGYTSYEWSTGATTQTVSGLPIGEYWVKLGHEGCFTLQTVKIHKAQDPVITNVEVNNTSGIVTASGGQPPYQYQVDGGAWQDSNVFNNLTRGQHIFAVKDALNCLPTTLEVTVPNLINAITPNGDNVNDYLDYSALAYKENLEVTIFDRYGNLIFKGEKFNNYKWDGRHFDKKIVTGTYWYVITWNEPNKEKTPVKYSGWILVKNR